LTALFLSHRIGACVDLGIREIKASARRHGISDERIRAAVRACKMVLYVGDPLTGKDDLLMFFGPDGNGNPLEVMGREHDDGKRDHLPCDAGAARLPRTLRAGDGHPMKRDKLSDADYERLADLAEKGFAPSDFHVRPRGRPSLGASGTSPRVATRVSPDVHQRARARAASEGKTISQVLRDLVEAYAMAPRVKRQAADNGKGKA
jgi:hypothetical protein